MNCPHCAQPITPELIRKAANSIAGSAKRPNAKAKHHYGRKGKPKPLIVCNCDLLPFPHTPTKLCAPTA